MVMTCVSFEVRTTFINVIYMSFAKELNGVRRWYLIINGFQHNIYEWKETRPHKSRTLALSSVPDSNTVPWWWWKWSSVSGLASVTWPPRQLSAWVTYGLRNKQPHAEMSHLRGNLSEDPRFWKLYAECKWPVVLIRGKIHWTNSSEESPSWEADIVPRLVKKLRNPVVHHRVHNSNSLSPVRVLSQVNSFHVITFCSRSILILFLLLSVVRPNSLVPLVLLPKILHVFLISPMFTTL
jgi:hypothetical protein